jgi:hypothetical protein
MAFDENGNWISNPSLTQQIGQFSLPSTPGGWNPNTGVMAAPSAATTPFGSGSWDAMQANRLAGPASTGPLSALGKLGGWLGKNGQTIGTFGNLASQGINAYVGLQQLGMAKDALKFEKKAFKTNLANQVDSYNTQMKDRTTGRWYATEEERQAALKDAELPQGMRG